MWTADLGNGRYKNPILYADYSDPDAIRVGNDYFMISSSFSNAPAMPLLHSKDLVNWKVVNYILAEIPEFRYRNPIHGCGVWAPAIRYHEGTYYVCFPMPDEGIYMTTATDPYGEWSKPVNIRPGAGWIDPCPFWDEDGKAYLVAGVAKSRIGYKSVLHMVEMQPDGMGLIGEEKIIFDGNLNDQITIEGPKMYKRNGWYYIFAPAGGVKTGWQTVLRSKNVFGPYEYKVVMRQGDSPVNGPHQGAWLDTQTGEDYFLHFQDVYAAGRIVHLQPVKWINDWPVMGEQINADAGQPVMQHRKPDIGEQAVEAAKNFRHENNLADIYAPDASDDFTGDRLGLQWQWNANHLDGWYSMTGHGIELYPVEKPESTSIANVPNLLLQKWIAPEFSAVTELMCATLEEGSVAGMVSLGVDYGAAAIRRREGSLSIISVLGSQTFKNEKAYSEDKVVELANIDSTVEKVFFRNRVESLPVVEKNVTRNKIYLDYSLDGTNYENVLAYEATAGRWVGVKNGIFCCHEIKQDEFNAAGSCEGKKRTGALFNCFRITELSK